MALSEKIVDLDKNTNQQFQLMVRRKNMNKLRSNMPSFCAFLALFMVFIIRRLLQTNE
ncbi:transmembrane protein, putative [Medicago truncatula]|uniref:Transmembrane protein, putative n=1 Tax=Medicago truncatula TaxID=3880 RepID=A0A072UYL3_MEDTR|nr:transmembrane protein, putative [Medicago truncatula]